MHNINKYANSSCKTCTYSIKCPMFAKSTADSTCKDCPNYDTTGRKHRVLNCHCFETASDIDICPYYKENRNGTNS